MIPNYFASFFKVFVVLLLNTSFSYWKEFFTKSDENFKDEKSDGIHIELHTDFYEDGQKKFEGFFKDGKKTSVKEWNEDGSVKE